MALLKESPWERASATLAQSGRSGKSKVSPVDGNDGATERTLKLY